MEKTKKSSKVDKEKKGKTEKKEKTKKTQKKELTVTRNVLKAMHLKCRSKTLSSLRKSDNKRYKKLIRLCCAFRTRVTPQTLGNRVFFSDDASPDVFHAASQHDSCWIKGSTEDSHYNRPNEKIATPTSSYYWRVESDIDDTSTHQYHPLIEYVARDDIGGLRLLILHRRDKDGSVTPQEQVEMIGQARRTAQKLLKASSSDKEKTATKNKRKRSKDEKKSKKAKKSKKSKKPVISSKRARYQLYESYYEGDDESDYDEEDESDSDEDGSYVPSDDDSDDEGCDSSSEKEDDDEEDDDSNEIDEELTLESASSSSSEEEVSTTY